MSWGRRPRSLGLVRGYLVLLLVGVALGGSSSYVLVVAILVAIHLATLARPLPPSRDLVLILGTVLLTPVALASLSGVSTGLALLASSPGLLLLDRGLRNIEPQATLDEVKIEKRATPLFITVVSALLGSGLLGFWLGNTSLLGMAGLTLAAVLARTLFVLAYGRREQISIESVTLRTLADSELNAALSITNHLPFPVRAVVSSSNHWIHVTPRFLELAAGDSHEIQITGRPPLAGPSRPTLHVSVLDPWGLLWDTRRLTPISVHVIPRARYAASLARQYLQQTSPRGEAASSRVVRFERGIEFHSLRRYQPGDRLRDIDWRHSAKWGDLIIKDYRDPQGGTTLLLVNLVASDVTETDWLAYAMVTSALTAAHEGMRAAIIAYDDHDTVLTTSIVHPRDAVKNTLRLAERILIDGRHTRFLAPPDLVAMRRNARRVAADDSTGAEGDAAGLATLSEIQLSALETQAQDHPLTDALRIFLRRTSPETVTIISPWNHDVEALAVVVMQAKSLGYRIVRPGPNDHFSKTSSSAALHPVLHAH